MLNEDEKRIQEQLMNSILSHMRQIDPVTLQGIAKLFPDLASSNSNDVKKTMNKMLFKLHCKGRDFWDLRFLLSMIGDYFYFEIKKRDLYKKEP